MKGGSLSEPKFLQKLIPPQQIKGGCESSNPSKEIRKAIKFAVTSNDLYPGKDDVIVTIISA